MFASGFTLEAVEAVVPDDEDAFEILDLLGVLVDKMLLLRGQPTTIAEQRDDAAREARLEEFRRRYGRVHAADAADAGANGGAP